MCIGTHCTPSRLVKARPHWSDDTMSSGTCTLVGILGSTKVFNIFTISMIVIVIEFKRFSLVIMSVYVGKHPLAMEKRLCE